MSNLTKGSENIGNKIKEHMAQNGWSQERREQLWNAVRNSEKQVFARIPLELILSSKNIRRGDNNTEIEKIASSIKSDGLIQNPLICLEKTDNGSISFVTVAGHRRLKALKLLGFSEVDCAIKIFQNESDRLVSSFIENDVRSNMDAFDTALAYLKMKESGLTSYEIASRTGKDISNVNRYLKFNSWSDGLVTKIRSMDKFPAVRDLFALLPLGEPDIFQKLDILCDKKNRRKSKKENDTHNINLRIPAYEKRYKTLAEVISKYEIDDTHKMIFSKILNEAKIIRKSL